MFNVEIISYVLLTAFSCMWDLFLTISTMFNDSSKKDGIHIQEHGEKSDSKVFVKTNNPVVSSNSESGYGSVLGVILVIVSISFIITALFIALLS